jgi:cation:H+ antiporter
MLSISLAIIVFLAGVILLYKGSDILVDGTTHVAAQLGVSSLIISVVVVAFGTSAPEFAISVGAAMQEFAGVVEGGADISVGNIIGSCIANLLLVIGLSAVIRPIKIQKGVIYRELPIMVLVTIGLIVFSITGLLDGFHVIGGLLFLLFFVLFVFYFIRVARLERIKVEEFSDGNMVKDSVLIVFGIAGVVLGAWFLIESAITIAHFFNISPFIISLSMVAVGTSLPELVVSVMASYKDESDIAVGNVLGSNVFNILLVLGAAALLIPLGAMKSVDHLVILLGVTLVMIPILRSNHEVSRLEGVFLLVLYAFFIWYMFGGSTFLFGS